MSATKIQCGHTNYRINREPLDAESVINSYSGLLEKIGDADEAKGALYPGMVVAVTNDNDRSRRGPWYISYEGFPGAMTYTADRIPTATEVSYEVSYTSYALENEINDAVNDMAYAVNDMAFNWGHLE